MHFYCAVPSISAALELLDSARVESGDSVETFELISRQVLDLVLKHIPDTRDPLNAPFEYYVLLEIVSTKPADDEAKQNFENMLEKALESKVILDSRYRSNRTTKAGVLGIARKCYRVPEIRGHLN